MVDVILYLWNAINAVHDAKHKQKGIYNVEKVFKFTKDKWNDSLCPYYNHECTNKAPNLFMGVLRQENVAFLVEWNVVPGL